MNGKQATYVQNSKKGTLGTYKKARKYATILRIKVDSSSASSLLAHISNMIDLKKQFMVVTPNPEIVIQSTHDTVLSTILNSAAISLPDGIGLIWASKFVRGNNRLKERVSGVDVMEALCKRAAENEWKVFLLGGNVGIAEVAAKHLISNFKFQISNLQYDSGPWLDDSGKPVNAIEAEKENKVIKKINEFKPELLFIAYGAPKQEKWAASKMSQLNVNCIMVVGGAFDYISGNIPRAPRFIQEAGLEWLYRLIAQPWRIKRQLALIKFVFLVLLSRR